MLDRRIILKWTINKCVSWNKLAEGKIEARICATAINDGKFVVDWATGLIQRTTMLHGIWDWKEYFYPQKLTWLAAVLFSKIGFQNTLTDGDKIQSGTDPVRGTHLCQVLRVNLYVPHLYYFEVCASLWYNEALICSYPRLGTVCWLISLKVKSKTAWPLKMGQIGCPETSVTRYKSTLCAIPEERRSQLHRGGSLFHSSVLFKTMASFWLFTPRIVLVLLDFLLIICVKYVCKL
jgi:hypothetical protein